MFKSPAYRRSSGGIDSASSAVIIYSMCRLVVEAVKAGNEQVIADVRMICAEDEWLPATPQELCGKIFHTCKRSLNSILKGVRTPLTWNLGYMGTEKNSSKETRKRAKDLSSGKVFKF